MLVLVRLGALFSKEIVASYRLQGKPLKPGTWNLEHGT
jgi:hypothetical protein